MNIQSGTIRYEEQEVHCLRVGNGPRLLLAFHGFDNDASIFMPLAEVLGADYTIVAIDLPGHGHTRWNAPFMEPEDLMALVQGFKNDLGVERLSLIGYSLGGRVCLKIIEKQPDWIEEVFLLASDGLTPNIWYALATQNFWGKRVFRYICRHPEGTLRKASWLRKLYLIDESRLKFARTKLNDDRVRKLLAYVWPVTSHLIPNRARVKNNINIYGIKAHVFSGRHDRIFPPEKIRKFIFGLRNTSSHIIDTGHNFSRRETMLEVATVISQSIGNS